MDKASILLKNIQENIERVIVGKTEPIHLILIALMGKGHVLIEDVLGVGKTMMAPSWPNLST